MPEARPDRPGLLGLATVRGISMLPTLHPGDVLLVRYVARAPRVRPGALVVVRLPSDAEGLARPIGVKRLVGLAPEGTGWWVERDNPRAGADSWSFGAVATESLIAVVIARVAPWRRVGLLHRRSPQLRDPGRTSPDGRHQREGE